MRSSLAFLLAGCLVALQAPARPVAGAALLDARYTVQTMGVDLGRAALRVDPVGDGLTTQLTFETDALLGFVEASTNKMAGETASSRGRTSPRSFEGTYRKEDRVREVGIGYRSDGAIDSFKLVKRGDMRLSAVPSGLPPGTIDPLAAFLRARAWLDQAPEGAELALSVFDGRKRYEATLRYLGLVQLTDDSGSAPAHRVAVRYRMVQALNEDTGVLEPEQGARRRDLELAVSADGRYLPLRLEGSLDGLPISATLSADCAGPSGCP
jgi:hypothetical protein